MIVTSTQAVCLSKALAELVGPPVSGNIAFLRCIPPELIESFVSHPDFKIPGWEVFAVTDEGDTAKGSIPADKAVEIREKKGPATVLIVDVLRAGAGMDGIYSAAKEIPEADLFKKAIGQARKSLPKRQAELVKEAVSRAKRLGERHTVSPWREFSFHARCAENLQDLGRALATLGLWPTVLDTKAKTNDLGKSARLVEKLLLSPASSKTPSARITALMLQDVTDQQRIALENVLRDAAGKTVPKVLQEVELLPEIWLNSIKPSFASDRLTRIELVSWRSRNGGMTAWSGLRLVEEKEDLPHLVLDSSGPASGLAVRWNTFPEEIAQGSVGYEISIVAASDVLATKTIDHSERAPQKVFFSFEDFDELDSSAKFQAKVVVKCTDTKEEIEAESEDFVIVFGTITDSKTYRGSGETVRCAVEGVISLDNKEDLLALCKKRGDASHFRTDSKSYIIIRPTTGGRSFRVFRPPLISEIEKQWKEYPDAIGRWTLQVRADGTHSGVLNFRPFDSDSCPENEWQRLSTASRLFCEDTMQGPGALSRVYPHDETISARAVEYLNAWESALSKGQSHLALANTLEVQDVAGKTIGLIVLPFHAVRVAWQAAYDALAIHARYEFGVPAARVRELLTALDSSQFPAFLPGLEPSSTFVFADTLGITAVAMVRDSDREPKAAVSTMALCLGAEVPEIAPSVGYQTAGVLAKEIASYLKYHESPIQAEGIQPRFLNLNALRPGDASTVVRALGLALKKDSPPTPDDDSQGVIKQIAYTLNLYPSSAQQTAAGRFLSQLAQRRRSGAGGIEKEDSWILEPLVCGGNRTIPRLRWARRDSPIPEEPAHVSLAFDTFVSKVVSEERKFESIPLHVFGLVAGMQRQFSFTKDIPMWDTWIGPEQDGEKHPAGRVLTERLNRVHAGILRATAKSLSASGGWPLLRTELNYDEVETLKTLHRLSDWVVTVDRNAGIEYFDSPKDARAVYDAYVIDAVPERDDLGCLQLITSTAHLDEVRGLLDQALAFMGLSSSRKNCEFLLKQLKALSGRLAMRLATATSEAHAKTSGELVALALTRAHCQVAAPDDETWLALHDGFFVPLDDVRDILPSFEREEGDQGTRADLLYVTAPARGGLCFRFVEVKYRRHLALARSLDLVESVSKQASKSRKIWLDWYFSDTSPMVRSLRRSRVARALRFYAEKACRHHLPNDVFERVSQEIDRMLVSPEDYKLSEVVEPNRGYIFCPEFTSNTPERLFPDVSHDTATFLFGPAALPDLMHPTLPAVSPIDTEPKQDSKSSAETIRGFSFEPAPTSQPSLTQPATLSTSESEVRSTNILLGRIHGSDEPVSWSAEINGNPHLMIVGLPGMGKTTCLVNLCRQLQFSGISPIVFSYHDDIDSKLSTVFPEIAKTDCQSLGFNPMRTTEHGPLAHIESAGQLRDIFGSIFTELGDLQLETIRTAIKASYETHGWGSHPDPGAEIPPPAFRDFYSRLQSSPKLDTRTQTLLARLAELDDYKFFSDSGSSGTLLDGARPVLLQIHKTKNAAVQSAYASFAFYRIYQDMFQRGRQTRITHAVIFDEAHRAARLRLIPTMAKECRKYGIALVLASQEAKDFDASLFSAIANYLILRVTENDAKALARNVAPSDIERRTADRLKQLPRYQALYFCEGRRSPVHLLLSSG